MTNLFLKVNKDLFKLGLNPTEILVLAQIMEFNTNTGDFFMSDKALAEAFGVSDKTISRTMKALEEKGFIKRNTKSAKGGKERHITVNITALECKLSTDNLPFVDNSNNYQQTICPLITDNLSFDNRQNDLIKENIIDNTKEKNQEIQKEEGTIENPYIIPRAQLMDKLNQLQQLGRGLFMDSNRIFYKMKEYKGE